MTFLLRKFTGINWPLFGLVAALGLFGIFAIYSATWMREQDFWSRQLVWLVLGLIVCVAVSLTDYHWIRRGAVPIYIAGLLGLVAVHLIGKTVYGSGSWLDLGVMSFQPSQLAILAGIMLMALFLSEYDDMPAPLRIALCAAITGIPCAMILAEPDLGSSLVWLPVMLAMLYSARIPARYLLTLILLAVAIIPLMVNFGLRPYQRQRIITFLDPELDPQGAGWTINQSLTAIGSGGWSGKGFKAENTLNELGFLPSTIVHNDFIFSVIGEQHGFLGGMLLLLAFLAFVGLGLYVSLKSKDEFGRLLGVGLTTLIFTHTFMNIGMTIGVTPITGLPLPLVSYGGSFVMAVLFSVGVLQSIWVHRGGGAGGRGGSAGWTR